jgi:hypothetical protein
MGENLEFSSLRLVLQPRATMQSLLFGVEPYEEVGDSSNELNTFY